MYRIVYIRLGDRKFKDYAMNENFKYIEVCYAQVMKLGTYFMLQVIRL